MGLDISVETDIGPLYSYEDYWENFNLYQMSRTFCNLISIHHSQLPSELFQLGKLLEIDLSPIFDMIYASPEEEDFFIGRAESEEEKQKVSREFQQRRQECQKDIQQVHELAQALLQTLEKQPEASRNIQYQEYSKGYFEWLQVYFADQSHDSNRGYSDNTLRDDLRNFIRSLDYATEKGANRVYFTIG